MHASLNQKQFLFYSFWVSDGKKIQIDVKLIWAHDSKTAEASVTAKGALNKTSCYNAFNL